MSTEFLPWLRVEPRTADRIVAVIAYGGVIATGLAAALGFFR